MMDKADEKLLIKYSKEINLCEYVDKNKLEKIGRDVVESTKEDDTTRTEWFDTYNAALKIAKQVNDTKTYPFVNSSNVKIPLILVGCVQFNARILPEIIQMGKAVQAQIIGKPTSELEARSKRVGDHMSLQTAQSTWNVDTDRMLMLLPLVGTVFRKWTYDALGRRAASHLCLPTEIIVNNDISSIESAERITHVLRMTKNEIVERTRYGLFREVELLDLKKKAEADVITFGLNINPINDDEKVLPSELENDNNKYIVYEQHCYLDLDEDGYKEPYIVTVIKENNEVVRIAPRFDENSFVYNAKKEIVKINPDNYFAAHIFIPAPDGTFLGIGFGQLLLHISSAANSITNNLIDAGTLSNLKAGFISKDLRLPKGHMEFLPGEWKQVDVPYGQRVQDSIFPLPVSEPSQALMSLLTFLIDFGKQVANINDILMGTPSAANMPATSVVALVEQGTKIYNSILKRLYESLRTEFNILYKINKKYFSLYPKKEVYTESGFVTEEDYTDENFNIIPVANPALGTDAVRLAKMQVLLQLAQDPLINRQEVYKRYFDVLGMSDPDKLFSPPPPPPPPSAEDILKQAQAKYLSMQTAEIQMKAELEALSLMVKEKQAQADAAYKGGQLANQRVQAISDMAKTEAVTSPQDVKSASAVADTAKQQSALGVDYGDVFQQTAQEISQNQLQQGGGQSYNKGGGEPQMQQAGGGEGAPQLPPELESALQGVSDNKNAVSPQGVVEAGKL